MTVTDDGEEFWCPSCDDYVRVEYMTDCDRCGCGFCGEHVREHADQCASGEGEA